VRRQLAGFLRQQHEALSHLRGDGRLGAILALQHGPDDLVESHDWYPNRSTSGAVGFLILSQAFGAGKLS
jgi:hypothetical protein